MNTSFRGISLRQVAEEDMEFLFRLFTDPGRCHLWMRGRRVYDEREFHQAWAGWTADMIGAKFVVESSGHPIGLVFEYDRTLEDGHTKLTSLLHEDSVGQGSGVIAAALLADWLFESLPLRKICMEVYGYNPRVIGILRKLGFAEEAIFKGDRFWNGSYWNMHVFAAHRETWPDLRARIIRKPRRAGQVTAEQPGANGKRVMNATERFVQVNHIPVRVDRLHART